MPTILIPEGEMGFPMGDYDAVEAALSAAGVTIGEMCRSVPMAHSTWTRWKAGRTGGPNLKQWSEVQRAVVEVCAKVPPKSADAA